MLLRSERVAEKTAAAAAKKAEKAAAKAAAREEANRRKAAFKVTRWPFLLKTQLRYSCRAFVPSLITGHRLDAFANVQPCCLRDIPS